MAVTNIRINGWRQGSIIKEADCRDYFGEAESVGVVITQTCDLVHHCLDGEPCVEILLGHRVEKENSQLKFGKNPRKLHIRLAYADNKEQYIEFVPHRRVVQSRDLLADISPDEERYLPEQDLRILTSWLAARYDRAALPDVFNDRLRDQVKGQAKIAKRISDRVVALFVDIHPFEELSPEEIYSVTLIAVVSSEFQDELADIAKEVESFAALMQKGNMDVKAKTLLENKAPYTLVTQYKRLYLDHISLRQDPPDPMPRR